LTAFLARPGFVLACGAGLGLLAWATDHVSSDSALPFAAGLGNLPSHWLATAFVIGVVSRKPPAGAIWAGAGLSLAVIVYYLAINAAGDRPGADLQSAGEIWLAVALIAGPIFGVAGAIWITGPGRLRPWAVALIAGAILGEALYLVDELDLLGPRPLSETVTVLAIGEASVALALPAIMLSSRQDRLTAVAGSAVLGLVSYAAITVVIETVREALKPF
jgi:hypothetical protein